MNEAPVMWEQAEVAGLLDRTGCVRVVSRNEEEAPIADAVGRNVADMLTESSRSTFTDAFARALRGEVVEVVLSGIADDGAEIWGRAQLSPSPENTLPVLFHLRRLPTQWCSLTERERDVLQALNECQMNAKRAAKRLNVSLNTLNSHRRSICQKCQLRGVGEFWVFVKSCR
jgi:DNA-binding NarL/FixJ family response regulator